MAASDEYFQRDLIYDLGVNNGRDSEFYLSKGFRVLGIEANPVLCQATAARLEDYRLRNQLKLLNVGVWREARKLPFYVNLDNDHWSSFDPDYGCRQNTRFEVVEVECLTVLDLLRRFGVPYYLKIDVEGADTHILSALRPDRRPPFISVEEFGVACIDALHRLGYGLFQFVAQNNKRQTPPNPAREGTFAPRVFDGTDSGLFGRELPGRWLPYPEARSYFTSNIRAENYAWLVKDDEWYDVHATSAAFVS